MIFLLRIKARGTFGGHRPQIMPSAMLLFYRPAEANYKINQIQPLRAHFFTPLRALNVTLSLLATKSKIDCFSSLQSTRFSFQWTGLKKLTEFTKLSLPARVLS